MAVGEVAVPILHELRTHTAPMYEQLEMQKYLRQLGTKDCTRYAPTWLWPHSQEEFKAQYFLWQLLCIENDARRARADAARRRAEAERADEGLEGVEREVAAKRKQAAGINKQRALLERKVSKRRAEMEKKVLGMPFFFACICLYYIYVSLSVFVSVGWVSTRIHARLIGAQSCISKKCAASAKLYCINLR